VITREWTSDAVARGPLGSPVMSADGATVYVNGRDERLWALNTADGTAKWSVPLDYLAQTPPSVTPEGLIVAGGGPGAKLTAIREAGDGAEKVWSRDDTEPLSTASLAGVGYTVVRDGDGMALAVFALGDGHTVNSYRLPNASGWPVGVSVGHDRRVVAATSDGRVYGFAPA
jgi:outer membrane protein assembly factor BamB